MGALAINNDDVIEESKVRRFIGGDEPAVLSDIYEESCNIVAWQRELAPALRHALDEFLAANTRFQTSMTLSPHDAVSTIHKALGGSELTVLLSEDVAELLDMFCCLFDSARAGLRLTVLDQAMCPRFHVDKVPCRLVTTYQGAATEWLPHHVTDRSKLGHGSGGKPDEQSGLIVDNGVIQQLRTGDVALLKGERWTGNEGAGLVHRSPALVAGERRLLLTLDLN